MKEGETGRRERLIMHIQVNVNWLLGIVEKQWKSGSEQGYIHWIEWSRGPWGEEGEEGEGIRCTKRYYTCSLKRVTTERVRGGRRKRKN